MLLRRLHLLAERHVWMMPLLLAMMVAAFFWRLLLPDQFTWLDSPDQANMVLPWIQFQALQWHQRIFPAWDPNSWLGQPLVGQGQPGSVNPVNWLLFLAPMKSALVTLRALNIYFIAQRWLGAVAGYALCRELGRTKTASVLGSIVFGLGGYVGNVTWPQMQMGAIWAPLALLFLFRAERGDRPLPSAILSGFFLGMLWLSGHHQAPLFISIAVGCVWLWAALSGAEIRWALLRLMAVSIAVAVMTGAVQTIPMAEYGLRALRWVGLELPSAFNQATPYFVHETLAQPAYIPLAIFLPNIDVGWYPFIGISAFALALGGVTLGWHERWVRWLSVMALCGILFTLVEWSLLHGVLYAFVPMVDKARATGAATAVFALAIAPLVALGLDRVTEAVTSRWLRQAGWTLLGFGLLLAVGLALVVSFGPIPPKFDERLTVTALCAMGTGALLLARHKGTVSPQAVGIVFLMMVLFEISIVTNRNFHQFGEKQERAPLLANLKKHADIAQFLKQRGGGRVSYKDSDIPYNFGDYFNIPAFESFTASVTANLWQHWIFKPEVRDILGIRYVIGKEPDRQGQKVVFESTSGLKVFENPSAYPRAWAVHQSRQVARTPDAAEMLGMATINARETAIFTGAPVEELKPCVSPAANQSSDEVQLTGYLANEVRISAELACPGMVILSDTYFPGWRATVDGGSAKIEEVYGVFRGVRVGSGKHEIVMSYRPWSLIIGAALSVAATVLALWAWRQSRVTV